MRWFDWLYMSKTWPTRKKLTLYLSRYLSHMSMWLSYWKRKTTFLMSAKSSICNFSKYKYWILTFGDWKTVSIFWKIVIQMQPKDAPTNPPHLPNLHFCEILVLSEQVCIFWNRPNEKNMLQIDLSHKKNWAYLILILYFSAHYFQLRTDQMEPKSLKLELIFISKQLLTGFTQVMLEGDFSGLTPQLRTT